MRHLPCILLLSLLFVSCQQETYYNVTLQCKPEECGNIEMTPSSHSVLEGTSVTFKATPMSEYVFISWGGSLSGTENPKTVSVTADMTVVANFELKTYPLSVSVEGEGTVNERVISTKTDYDSGTVVELLAQPASHWVFDHWEGDLNGNTNPAQVSVTSAKIIKAVFVKKMYNLTIAVEGEGVVSEVVVETKSSSYQEGTEVELTAIPATGWSFDRWEGDLSGADNPIRLTISGAKSIKAVFAKNKYTYNLKIVGPGVVDEYIMGKTKNELEYGTQVLLKAYPDEVRHAVFKGWSGDISGNDQEIVFNIDKDMSILATFEPSVKQYPLPDLLLPTSVRKDIYYDVFFPYLNTGVYCALDYNMDGFIDLVTCTGANDQVTRNPIRFYMGKADGSFIIDQNNSDKFEGLLWWRKTLYGDFNGDKIPDICLVGHGWDYEPWPGEYPVLLFSTNSGQFIEKRLTDVVGYFHGSAAGDIDNDGDLDIFLLNNVGESIFLLNDGEGNFTRQTSLFNSEVGGFTTELFDVNHDGYLDLIVGGHEHEGKDWHQYTNQAYVFFGNGQTFKNENFVRFPAFEKGWGVTLDYIFEDLDGDGIEEIISCRTGDGVMDREFYSGWKMHIVSLNEGSLKDVTSDYINPEDSFEENCEWLIKIGIEDIDNGKYLVGLNYLGTKYKLYKIEGTRFMKCENPCDRPHKYTNGMCVFSDGAAWSGETTRTDCTEDPFGGNNCIRFSQWETWNGWELLFPYWVDFSDLEKEGYVLEFVIKNTDPNLMLVFQFETRLQTEPWYFPSYSYTYWGHLHETNGNWELIQVPLSEFKCGQEWTGYYWDTIKALNILPGECHGKDLFLDEIRIRKVLSE